MILSSLPRISARDIPRIAPLRKMFSRPVSSGWKPVHFKQAANSSVDSNETGAGAVMRDMILSRVLLPAPFLPIMPRMSP